MAEGVETLPLKKVLFQLPIIEIFQAETLGLIIAQGWSKNISLVTAECSKSGQSFRCLNIYLRTDFKYLFLNILAFQSIFFMCFPMTNLCQFAQLPCIWNALSVYPFSIISVFRTSWFFHTESYSWPKRNLYPLHFTVRILTSFWVAQREFLGLTHSQVIYLILFLKTQALQPTESDSRECRKTVTCFQWHSHRSPDFGEHQEIISQSLLYF